MAQSARHVDPPRAVVDRARRAAHRRACITALPRGEGSNAGHRRHDRARPARRRDLQQGQERRLPELAGAQPGRRPRSSTARTSTASRSPSRSTCGPSPAASTGPTPRRRRRRASSRSARSSARSRCAATSVTRFDPNSRFTVSMLWSGDKAWRQSGERRMLCGLQLPGAEQPAAGVQGQGRRHRPVEGVARRHVPWHRPVHQPADRHPGRLRGTARHGGHRRGQPRREVPGRAAAGARAGRVHQGRVHPDDRRLPGAHPAAQHHADADLQHDLAAELVGGQPPGVVQHRRHARQRRLVDAAQQRQGAAA